MPSGGLWCKVAVTLPRHIKTERLAADLGIPIPEAVGRLVMMWIYAVEMSPSGLLTEDDIQRSFCLNSDLSVSMAVQALTAAGGSTREGFLVQLDDGGLVGRPMYALHDWGDYSGVYDGRSRTRREEVRGEKKDETPASAAVAADEDARKRAALRKERDARTAAEPPLYNGRGYNFKGLQDLFAAAAKTSSS